MSIIEGTPSFSSFHLIPTTRWLIVRLCCVCVCVCVRGRLAEWSTALAAGASPQGREFEPHGCHRYIAMKLRSAVWLQGHCENANYRRLRNKSNVVDAHSEPDTDHCRCDHHYFNSPTGMHIKWRQHGYNAQARLGRDVLYSNVLLRAGLEPAISSLGGRRLIH